MHNTEAKTTSTNAPPKRRRGKQERAEITKAKLLQTGREMFSSRGFDGVSVRELEAAAGVQRNLLSYHFGDKDRFWKAVADDIYGLMKSEFQQRTAIMHEISSRDVLALIVRFYVQFHARHPELSRLMAQEATQHSWRIQYLIDEHIRPSTIEMEKLVREAKGLDRDAFIHWYYIMISSTSTIFSFAAECQDLFGVDPCDDKMVAAHAEMLVNMLLKQD